MYLLKPLTAYANNEVDANSHSTMYLLKLDLATIDGELIKNSHSTMYLLKPVKYLSITAKNSFTFHHVSIKTQSFLSKIFVPCYSHSTMYLLKRMHQKKVKA